MGRRAGQEVNNCDNQPWARFQGRAFIWTLIVSTTPHPPTVPRMIVRNRVGILGVIKGASFSLWLFFNPLLREISAGILSVRPVIKSKPYSSHSAVNKISP